MRYDVLEALTNSDKIVSGNDGEMLAYREVTPGKFLVVVYRELVDDGFIITAFLTRRLASLNRRKQIWPA